MKLPPAALTAPSLCPRCDAPAILTEYCVTCALPLGRCGSCQGVAGPFDRYCGFCGYELLRGDRRAPLWRLWLLAALIPLAAGLAIGVSPLGPALARGVAGLAGSASPGPSNTTPLRSDGLQLQYAIPKDWTAVDGTRDPARPLGFVVASSVEADQARAIDARSDLLQLRPQGAVVAIGRPGVTTTAVDSNDPRVVLDYEIALLVQTPPPGLQLSVTRAVHPVTIAGRPAAEAVLRVTRDGQSYVFERAWLATGRGLLRADAMVPEGDWNAGDQARVEAVITSIRG